MTEEVRAASEDCRQVLLHVVKLISAHFPIHAQALHGELAGTKLTDERWSRVVCVLHSLRGIPGMLLSDEEKECRAHALRAVALAQRMQQLSTGVGRTEDSLRFVLHETAEFRGKMT